LRIALCGAGRYIPLKLKRFRAKWIPVRARKTRQTKDHQQRFQPQTEETMRAEVERLVEEIKQSVGLLRRHL
jgi:hypothetical protein